MRAPRNKAADRAVDFISNLKLTGDYLGQPTVLRPWQESIVRHLFGKIKPDGRLQTETCFLFLPRKQSKTELAASILLLCLLGRGKRGQEIYSAAASRDQAARIYKAAASKIRQDPFLSSICTCIDSKKRIQYPNGDSFYCALSNDAKTKFGDRPSVVLFDELHAQQNRNLYNALMSGFGATLEPLTILISTAGEDRSGLCREEFNFSSKIKGRIENGVWIDDGIIDDPRSIDFMLCSANQTFLSAGVNSLTVYSWSMDSHQGMIRSCTTLRFASSTFENVALLQSWIFVGGMP